MNYIPCLMDSALVSWIRTFENDGGIGVNYEALADGVFLYDVLTHLSPRGASSLGPVNRCPEDSRSRLSNLATVLCFLNKFYTDSLGQMILTPPADVITISNTPEGETAVSAMRRILLLVLGCAVQSPMKEEVVLKIKQLPLEVQHGIVQCIQEITDDPAVVWPQEWSSLDQVPPDTCDKAFGLLVTNCKRLLIERDYFHEELLKTLLGVNGSSGCCNTEDDYRRAGVQMADLKAQLRRLRQEYDEKNETAIELKDEMQHVKASANKLRQENIELIQDARAARALRDEADILRERASKVDMLEGEISKYREKMTDIDFYKSRMEELREDNRILSETKEMLEDQLATSRKRAEKILEWEKQIMELKQTINHLNIERVGEQQRIDDLLQENADLQLQAKNCLNESTSLVAHAERIRAEPGDGHIMGKNVGKDIIDEAETRILKLELENRRLEGKIENMKKSALVSTCEDGFVELQKENKRLTTKVAHLENMLQKEKSRSSEVQEKVTQSEQRVKILQDDIQDLKEEHEMKEKELQADITHWQDQIDNVRAQQVDTEEERLKVIRKDYKQLVNKASAMQFQISRLEHEKIQLQKSSEHLLQMEKRNNEFFHDNLELSKQIEALKETQERYDELERNLASLEVEYSRTNSALETSRDVISKLNMKEKENEKLMKELRQLQANCITVTAKNNQLEVDLATVNSDSSKLKRSLATFERKLVELEKEKGEVEAENTKLIRTVETLKLTTKRLNEVEKELTEVEASNDRICRENRSLKKEVERIKNSLEIHQTSLESASTKASKLERENMKLIQEVKRAEDSDCRLKELEQQRLDMEQKSHVERETLTALREDLVAEKVKTQLLTNQLENFCTELKSFDIENLLGEDNSNRMKNNGSVMLEDVLKNFSAGYEEKIVMLEGRLSESSVQIQHLRDQLSKSRSDCEVLQQNSWTEVEPRREIQKIQDELVKVQEERSCLESEVNELSSQSGSYRDQVCALQAKVGALDSQISLLTKQNLNLLGENATLQVQATTLESQTNSLLVQNESLQRENSSVESDRDKIKRLYEDRGGRLIQLMSDYETMQSLHQQLTQEYESLRNEHTTLKHSHRSSLAEVKTAKDRENHIIENENELIRLKESFDQELQQLKKDSNSLTNLRAEHSRLKEDFRSLFTEAGRLRNEAKRLEVAAAQASHSRRETELALLKAKGEMTDAQDALSSLDIQCVKMSLKCQVLEDANSSLESDRRGLMEQVSLLLSQYHELLTHTLQDKQTFHNEEKMFTDKLNNLRRQKEKLEEKIMDHYRKLDNSATKKKGFGSNLVKRVRKAGTELIGKVPRSNRSLSRGREEDSSSGSSVDSGSDMPRTPTLSPADGKVPSPSIDEIRGIQINSVCNSISSEEIGDSVDSNLEDSSSSVSTGDLSRAGCRKPVYLPADPDNADSQKKNSINSSLSSLMRCSLNGPAIANNLINHVPFGLPQSSSTPVVPNTHRPNDEPDEVSTPRLPPRREIICNEVPEIPPRDSRISSSVIPDSSSGSAQGTPQVYRRAPPLPPTDVVPPLPPRGLTDNSKPKDEKPPNSVWYEYGCV